MALAFTGKLCSSLPPEKLNVEKVHSCEPLVCNTLNHLFDTEKDNRSRFMQVQAGNMKGSGAALGFLLICVSSSSVLLGAAQSSNLFQNILNGLLPSEAAALLPFLSEIGPQLLSLPTEAEKQKALCNLIAERQLPIRPSFCTAPPPPGNHSFGPFTQKRYSSSSASSYRYLSRNIPELVLCQLMLLSRVLRRAAPTGDLLAHGRGSQRSAHITADYQNPPVFMQARVRRP